MEERSSRRPVKSPKTAGFDLRLHRHVDDDDAAMRVGRSTSSPISSPVPARQRRAAFAQGPRRKSAPDAGGHIQRTVTRSNEEMCKVDYRVLAEIEAEHPGLLRMIRGESSDEECDAETDRARQGQTRNEADVK